jgi:hypothetical protein
MRLKPVLFAAACILLATSPALAKHWHEGEKHGKHAKHADYDDERCYLESRDVRVITEYYAPGSRRSTHAPVISLRDGSGKWSRFRSWSSDSSLSCRLTTAAA